MGCSWLWFLRWVFSRQQPLRNVAPTGWVAYRPQSLRDASFQHQVSGCVPHTVPSLCLCDFSCPYGYHSLSAVRPWPHGGLGAGWKWLWLEWATYGLLMHRHLPPQTLDHFPESRYLYLWEFFFLLYAFNCFFFMIKILRQPSYPWLWALLTSPLRSLSWCVALCWISSAIPTSALTTFRNTLNHIDRPYHICSCVYLCLLSVRLLKLVRLSNWLYLQCALSRSSLLPQNWK